MGILDVTDFLVNCEDHPWNLWSFKHRFNVLKYEIVLHMKKDLIVWWSGPWTGRTNDMGIFNQRFRNLLGDEKLVADSIYKCDNCIIAYKEKNTQFKKRFNWECHAISAKIENLNSRLKQFYCLKHPWRHDIKKHKWAFTIIINLNQIKLQTNPLRK
jgi:hypothetical protein